MPRPVHNPPNPWLSTHVEYIDEPPPPAALEVFEEDARSVVSRNDSPDLPFTYSVNPYRGCYHGCAYCYARPSHQYLGWGAGTDFERRIVVKRNAPELLREFFRKPGWTREPVVFSGVTDCYQPLEASYALTRGCLEACLEHRTPVRVITKSPLVVRDAALLAELGRVAGAVVVLSIPFADDDMGRRIEPYAARVSKRFEAIAALTRAGVRTGVGVAPVIPALNDSQIPQVLARAREAGATSAFMTLLRLPAEVLPVFTERLHEVEPLRAKAVLTAIRDVRGGGLNNATFGQRMRGQGPRWEAIDQLFEMHARRLGFRDEAPEAEAPRGLASTFAPVAAPAPAPRVKRARPADPRQRSLFDDD